MEGGEIFWVNPKVTLLMLNEQSAAWKRVQGGMEEGTRAAWKRVQGGMEEGTRRHGRGYKALCGTES